MHTRNSWRLLRRVVSVAPYRFAGLLGTIVLNVGLLGVSTVGIAQTINILNSHSTDPQIAYTLAWAFGSLLMSSAFASSIGPQWLPILERVITSQIDDCLEELEAAEGDGSRCSELVDISDIIGFSNRQYLNAIVDWLRQRCRGLAGLALLAIVSPLSAIVCAAAFMIYGAFFTNVLANILESLGGTSSDERRKARYVRRLLLAHETAGEWRIIGALPWLRAIFEDCSRIAISAAAANRERGVGKVFLSSMLAFAVVAGVVASLVLKTWDGGLSAGELSLGFLGLMYAMDLGPIGDTGVLVRQAADLNGLVGRIHNVPAERQQAILLAGRPTSPAASHRSEESDLLLELRDVVCRYQSPEGFQLSIENFHVSRGEMVAVVGHNGSGKSTLISLIAGVLEPLSGDLSVYSSRISIVPQVPVKYPASISANIDLGVPDVDVVEQAEKVNVSSKVHSHRASEDLNGADELSGGQWQRVAIARALGRQSELLVLDEPSAALDVAAEADLFGTIVEQRDGRGILVATHHLANARLADRIVVLEAGRIVEEGTHSDLMAMDKRYAEFYRIQAASVGVES